MAGLALPKVECIEGTETYGRFVAEPVEKGFGVTLGNAMRRVLLSSLPGAAINWVVIESIQHEFSTVPHVKEDTIDFLLNVKGIRLRHLAQRSGRLRLEAEGEGQVCAGDIKPSSDFEIVNPELYLATLDSPKAKLSVELNVEIGRGYVPASSSDSLPIGTIPIDAIFTPVRKVNFLIEPSSLREGSNQEKLILEVWTDGSISPIEAVTQSAAILIEQFGCFRELARAITQEGAEVVWQRLIPPEQYLMPLDQLSLSTHTYNSLRRGGVTTLGQILERGLDGLCGLAGFGAKSRDEVEAALKRLDLPFIPEAKEKKKRASGASASEKGESAEDKGESAEDIEGKVTD
ncbi:MAG: DNA-directed RNA polymerase subunit alpha [Chloroflexi bacterium]|nr:DNA-directed RNA polymerase subunit alpha [Chloroflexota bacterium]MBL7061725.1 DNA-directed RNA polymerase subunit alpha [Dehalococcoidia bacterium]